MTQQTQPQQSNDKVGDAAASLGIPREWVNDPSRGLTPMERFEGGHNAPRYYPTPQQQQRRR
ncbi:hypothetical protein B9Z19DRAFT_1137322 [Tuber borchii]|uniref:Uncharacterized protein n=1 Tax=Tuber borchii TaxID=42251 RepID=A0A2T6ZAP1_TUBBO|nr:hypothetical protein B9Z19DRAFT_1137322 [Tuber borchii]